MSTTRTVATILHFNWTVISWFLDFDITKIYRNKFHPCSLAQKLRRQLSSCPLVKSSAWSNSGKCQGYPHQIGQTNRILTSRQSVSATTRTVPLLLCADQKLNFEKFSSLPLLVFFFFSSFRGIVIHVIMIVRAFGLFVVLVRFVSPTNTRNHESHSAEEKTTTF